MAGLAEIGGGYLIWQWIRNGKPIWIGAIGGIVMILYGVIATLQVFSFGKAYAAYGGVFIILALLWGWFVDGLSPDFREWIGACICLIGVVIMIGMPKR